jgi:hypothetical protein
MLSVVRKQHLLADEGSYFLANNNSQTGILSSAATGFVATTPALVIYNTARRVTRAPSASTSTS